MFEKINQGKDDDEYVGEEGEDEVGEGDFADDVLGGPEDKIGLGVHDPKLVEDDPTTTVADPDKGPEMLFEGKMVDPSKKENAREDNDEDNDCKGRDKTTDGTEEEVGEVVIPFAGAFLKGSEDEV